MNPNAKTYMHAIILITVVTPFRLLMNIYFQSIKNCLGLEM